MRAIIIFYFCTAIVAFAQTEGERREHFNLKRNVALDGFDPVSYFEGKPREGNERTLYTHKGVTYYFASANSREKFRLNPEKYEPAYGGWCAYAMGKNGEKVKVDQQTYKLINGKLYLFYNFWTNNTLDDWNKNEKKLKQAADVNWQKTFQ